MEESDSSFLHGLGFTEMLTYLGQSFISLAKLLMKERRLTEDVLVLVCAECIFLRMISVLPLATSREFSSIWSPSVCSPPTPLQCQGLLFLCYLSALFIPSVEHSCHFALLYKQISVFLLR